MPRVSVQDQLCAPFPFVDAEGGVEPPCINALVTASAASLPAGVIIKARKYSLSKLCCAVTPISTLAGGITRSTKWRIVAGSVFANT
jgi:hypothetical protein